VVSVDLNQHIFTSMHKENKCKELANFWQEYVLIVHYIHFHNDSHCTTEPTNSLQNFILTNNLLQ
jgi:hypothetical protein